MHSEVEPLGFELCSDSFSIFTVLSLEYFQEDVTAETWAWKGASRHFRVGDNEAQGVLSHASVSFCAWKGILCVR